MKITMLNHSKAEPMGILRDVLWKIRVTTILVKFLILDMPVDKDVPIVVGRTKKKKKNSENGEEYYMERDMNGKPIYGSTPANHLNCDDPLDRALALQEALNPFKKVGIWKKMVAFLGSLPIPLQHMEWIPSYSDNFSKKGGGDGKWYTKIRIVNPYGNVYDQGCEIKTTMRELLRSYQLSDIMSNDWL
ncbi:hypothetical protein Tco_1173363 [Tanacetum coccineum]